MNTFHERGPEHAQWSRAIRDRDNHVCLLCHRYGMVMHAHHINSFSHFEELRLSEDNGATLCVECHDFFHSVAGKELVTFFDLKNIVKTFKAFKTAIEKINNLNEVE